MKVIKLIDILNKSDYPKAGSSVFTMIDDAIISEEVIVLDMVDVISVPTMFMNTSFGATIDKYGVKKLKDTIRFTNITKTQAERIQKYFSDYENILKAQ